MQFDDIENKPMRISRRFSVDDWKALNFSTEEQWQKAIDIFEDRIHSRFFQVTGKIAHDEQAGFAVLALDCLLIETLQQFREGVSETPSNKSGEYFVRFLTGTSFSNFFCPRLAEMFYKKIRCGILHQAEIKGSSRVVIQQQVPLVRLAKDGNGLIINRNSFHKQLINEFKNYVSQLRKNDPADEKLRLNFKKKMNHICQVSGVIK